jgi:hypothetical protein
MAPDDAAALCRDLSETITIHPYRIDMVRDRLLLLRLTLEQMNGAAFLDQRVQEGKPPGAWLAWERVSAIMAGRQPGAAAHYLFHVGHCGSTLVSRLLGELGVTALREPLPLRTLAETHMGLDAPESRWSRPTFDTRLTLLTSLFDRGAGPRTVKATSFCSDLAISILASHGDRRATVVFTALRPYLANVLAGPASRVELQTMAPMRHRRLRTHVGDGIAPLHGMSPGQVAAMSWMTEMTALAAVPDVIDPGRLAYIDFDRFLVDAGPQLRRLADHVQPGIPDEQLFAAVSGSTMTRYSKAPEHAYDARLRQEVLADGERRFGDEIRSGLAWCERVADRSPAVARALAVSGHA